MPDIHEQHTIITILQKATQEAAQYLVAGHLLTCKKFHELIIASSTERMYELIVRQLTYLEIVDEVPYVNIFVSNEGEIYRCNIFLYPVNDENEELINVRIEVAYEDWGVDN